MKKVYVYPGYGYSLEELDLSNYEGSLIAIDEIVYKCLMLGLGDITPAGALNEEERQEYEENERYILIDISMCDIDNNFNENMFYFNVENMKAENIDICC